MCHSVCFKGQFMDLKLSEKMVKSSTSISVPKSDVLCKFIQKQKVVLQKKFQPKLFCKISARLSLILTRRQQLGRSRNIQRHLGLKRGFADTSEDLKKQLQGNDIISFSKEKFLHSLEIKKKHEGRSLHQILFTLLPHI